MGWINEGGAGYLEMAAKDYLLKSEYGKSEIIAVAPTWEENFSFTDGIRNGLKEKGVLKEGVVLDVVSSFQWTRWQREQFSNYKEGYVVTPNKKLGPLEKGVSYVVEKVDENYGRVVFQGGQQLSLKQAKFFDVGLKRQVEVSEDDRILLQSNDKKQGLINGKVVTVDRVEGDGRIMTKEGITIPSGYRLFTHGYVMTSHKSQGKTADHVVIAAAKLDEKAAYVATSRGRLSCNIHTPETESLIAGARQSSLRVGVFDGKEKLPSYQESLGFNNKPILSNKLDNKNIEKETAGKIIIPEGFQSLPSPTEKLRFPRLRSMNPMKNQSVRVNSFGEKLSLKVSNVIEAAKKVGHHVVNHIPITIRQNIAQKPPSQSFRI